jgi:hypothetical protein
MPPLRLALLLLGGCAPPSDAPDPPVVVDAVPPAAVARLTDAQWRSSVSELLHVSFDGWLPQDYVLHGHAAVGASTLSTSPLELEQYEGAAWDVAQRALATPEDRAARLGCDVEVSGRACVEAWVTRLTREAWRRPIEIDELEGMLTLYDTVAGAGTAALGAQAVTAATLLSPWFLYRVESGEPDPEAPGSWRYTGDELAARLALLLTRRGPDAALQADAEAGVLNTAEGVRAAAARLLDTPAAREAMARFWEEVFDLDRLDGATKNAYRYPYFDAALREQMVAEVTWLMLDTTLDRDADLREVFTTRQSLVDAELAALYGLPTADGPLVVELPGERGGLLGRAAIAAIHSHPESTSPTRRGKFIRTRLLCQSVLPPPPGVSTSLDDLPEGTTMRHRLEAHAENPACSSCHELIDPPGFGMEHLDPTGRWRTHDNNRPVNANGTLDGAPFNGVAELGAVIADHPELPGCFALDLWRFASGQPESEAQLPAIGELGAAFADGGFRWRALLLDLLASDAFRRPSPGDQPSPAESCDGVDNDRDGAVDEVVSPCAPEDGAGLRRCVDGAWSTCTAVGGQP